LKRLSKGRAFWAGFAGILALACLVAWRAPDTLADFASDAVYALVGLVTAFAGANVFDNWQKAKHYQPEMDKNKGEP
jgi:hypothetical protein